MGEEGSSNGGQRKGGLGSQKCDGGRFKSQIAVVWTSELIAPEENDREDEAHEENETGRLRLTR